MQATQPYTKIRKMGVPSEERVVLRCVALRRVDSLSSHASPSASAPNPLAGGSSRGWGVFLARNRLGATVPT